MRNILPWRSHPVLPQLGSWGAGTEAPLCSGQKGWSPGRTWIFPISLSQMRPAWRNQCYWSCSSTCESNRHRFTSSKAPVMGYESANCSVKSRLSHWSGPALGPMQPSGPALVQSFFQDLSPAPGLCRVHYLPTAGPQRDWKRHGESWPRVCYATGELAVQAPRTGERA